MPTAFPVDKLPLPPPVDQAFGQEVLASNPWIREDPVKNITAWLQNTVSYKLDPGEENYWVTPRQVVLRGSGNCEDVTLLFLSLASAAGVPAGIAFYYDPKTKEGHTVAYIDGGCCPGIKFVQVVEAQEAKGVRLLEAPSLDDYRAEFNYPLYEVVEKPRIFGY